jgi:UDP-glucose 4-epimerase
MSVWITGANGFIARHLARRLADSGVVVNGIGYGAPQGSDTKHSGYRDILNGGIDAPNLQALAARAGVPDVIYHLAGGSSVAASIAQPQEDFARTVTGTERLLEWMRVSAPQCRLIAISSAAVYGANHPGPIPETATLDPMSPYGQHKRMMEQLCESHSATFGTPITVVRLFSVYGPLLRKQLLWDLCNRLQSGERNIVLSGTGTEMRDWTSVHDVARLLAMLPAKDSDRSFHALNGGSGAGTSVATIARCVVESWGDGAGISFSGNVRAGDPTSLVSDSKRIEAMGFNWTVELNDGIAEYVRWFKETNS